MTNETEPEEAREPIHQAVELLLARMETNPEEFKRAGGKWTNLYEPYTNRFNKTEKHLINTKLREIHMREMHEGIMKKMVEYKEGPVKMKNHVLTTNRLTRTWMSDLETFVLEEKYR